MPGQVRSREFCLTGADETLQEKTDEGAGTTRWEPYDEDVVVSPLSSDGLDYTCCPAIINMAASTFRNSQFGW